MDKGNGVRKYSRLRQCLRWGKYLAHQIVVVPISIAALAAFPVGCIGAIASLVFMVGCLDRNPGSAVFGLLAFLLSVNIVIAGRSFLHKYMEAPVGNVLNPAPPENAVLPDKELLARASSSSAAQPAELLRATTETKEEKPEELLRGAQN